jgi:replicative DNA helicase Mcm
MEENEILEKFEEFLRSRYIKELARVAREGKSSLEISFQELDRFDPELADLLVENPERVLEIWKQAIRALDLPLVKEITPRLRNIPDSWKLAIREIRSKHIGKLIAMEGLVRQASDVRPVSTAMVFECPACGTLIEEKQRERRVKEPFRCPNCGKKGRFSLHEKKLEDTQRIVIEECPEILAGGEQPKRISVFLNGDLVDPEIVKRTCPGTKVRVIGVVKDIPLVLRTGGVSTRFDLIIQANNIIPIEMEFEEIELSDEDIKRIGELAKNPKIYEKLVASIAPTIFGYEEIKEAIALQLFGGIKKVLPDGTTRKGDIHVLLVGDPGVAKTMLLKYVATLAPKARYVTGKGLSGVGLTAAIVRDEFLRGWSLEAGALVLTNKGICVIDDIDKMGREDRVAMHEAMEIQTVSISKANIHATLRAETTILAAANPRLGRFDPYVPIAEQIDLPPTLINRFDLIFTIRDIPDVERDKQIARHILETARSPHEIRPEIAPKFMRKFIAYAKQNCKPELSDEAMEEIQNFYVGLRGKRSFGEEEVRPIPISARQLEALIRLSEASARIRLSRVVTREDAKRAIRLLKHCLKQVGIDPETGEFDIDRIVTGITATQRSRIILIKEIMRELEEKVGENILISRIIEEAKERGIEEAKAEEIIERMKRDGEIFEPKHGVVRRMRRE